MAAVGGDGDTEHGIAPDDDMTASLIDHDPQVETPAAEPDMLPDILPPEPEGSEQTAPPAATDAETQSEAPAVTPEPAAPLSPVSAIRKSSAPRKPRGRKLGG
ncbi:MAG TPA: hypothetical protein VF649_01060 [Sphingomonas sp.]|uniref:hypothetical protein n=1 Tax=Sphingomonas sp. TaxID=28214 RepID=UPI002ED7F5F0